MAFDVFLKIDGIPGESKDAKHAEWIEITGYNHGLSLPASLARSTSGATDAARVDHNDFAIQKFLDKASPLLALHCCNGKHIPSVVVELCRATGEKTKFMEYKMADVVITSVRPMGQGASQEPLPIEEVTFNYGKINWTYTVVNEKGVAGGNVAAGWDTAHNQAA